MDLWDKKRSYLRWIEVYQPPIPWTYSVVERAT
jgi:hypothetical protein